MTRIRSGAVDQRGGFLLEALIGILIFTLGVLGLMALQARAIGYTSDTQYRGEAAFLANAYLSRMWADSHANLLARYDDAGEPEYDAFAQAVSRLPGAPPPTVVITQPAAGGVMADAGNGTTGVSLSNNSTLVTITINWQQPSNDQSTPVMHNYVVSAVIGRNGP